MQTTLGTPTLSAVFFFVLIVLVTLLVTWWAAKRTRSMREFYAAGRSVSPFQNGLALAGDYMKAQLRELVTKYDPAVLWFDGEWVDWWTEEDGQALYKYVRGLKPDIIINNRVGKGRKGMA